jgi:uncharacterized integral membrane protein
MNHNKREKWEKVRTKGQSEFVLKQGGLVFGFLFVGIIIPILRFTVEFVSNDFTFSFFNKGFQLSLFLHLFAAFPIGCLWGWLSWQLNEFTYSRSKSVE